MTAPIRSILFVHSGALGDTVLHLQLAQLFRRALDEVSITWLGQDSWLPVVRRCHCIDRLVGLDAMGSHRLFGPGDDTPADLRDWLASFDLILNSLAPADSLASQRLHRLARCAAVTYDPAPRQGAREHITTQWLDQIADSLSRTQPQLCSTLTLLIEQHMSDPCVLLQPAPGDIDAATALLSRTMPDGLTDRLVLVHPGSGGKAKCWPMGNYVQLMEVLTQRVMKPVMIFGPTEMERLADERESLRGRRNMIADPSLADLIGLAGRATTYIGNDSGPTHVAAALGTATVALFGPTDPRVWRPVGPNVKLLQSQRHTEGWTDLTPEMVAHAICP